MRILDRSSTNGDRHERIEARGSRANPRIPYVLRPNLPGTNLVKNTRPSVRLRTELSITLCYPLSGRYPVRCGPLTPRAAPLSESAEYQKDPREFLHTANPGDQRWLFEH